MMLQVDHEYILSDGRTLTVLERLDDDQGVSSRVFKVELSDPSAGWPKVLAAKEPREEQFVEGLKTEANVLQRIEAAYVGSRRSPVPRFARFEAGIVSRNHSGVTSALLMELIEAPLLGRVYQQVLNSSDSEGHKRTTEAELVLWRAGKQYLEFLRKLLYDVQLVSGDRKYDTFRWDYRGHVRDGHLVIIDWNQSNPATASDSGAYRAVRLMVQNWYILFTGRDPIDPPPRYAEERWGSLSLGGRDVLLDVFTNEVQYRHLGTADKVLQRVEEKVDYLVALFSNNRFLHDEVEKGGEIAGDIAWRIGYWGSSDDARSKYEDWLTRHGLRVESSPNFFKTLVTPAAPTTNTVVNFVQTIRESIYDFWQKNTDVLKRQFVDSSLSSLVSALDDTLEMLKSEGYDVQTAEGLQERVDGFKKAAAAALTGFAFEEDLKELDRFVRSYRIWSDIQQELAEGVPSPVKIAEIREKFQLVKRYLADAPGVQKLLDLTPKAVEELERWLVKQPRDVHLPLNIYDDFIAACQDLFIDDSPGPTAFRDNLARLLRAGPTPEYVRIVRLYQAAFERAEQFVHFQPFTRTQMFDELIELSLFVEQFPELRSSWVWQLRFVRHALDIYNAEKAKYYVEKLYAPWHPRLLVKFAELLKKLKPA